MSDGVACPKSRPVGDCCAIQKSGAVFLQELLACRADVVKRVPITKRAVRGAEENSPMDTGRAMRVTNPMMELIENGKRTARAQNPALSDDAAFEKVCKRDPRLYDAHRWLVSSGQQTAVAAPVAKAAPSAQEQVYAMIEARVAEIRKARGGEKRDAMDEVFRADPALYETYRRSVGRVARPSGNGED